MKKKEINQRLKFIEDYGEVDNFLLKLGFRDVYS